MKTGRVVAFLLGAGAANAAVCDNNCGRRVAGTQNTAIPLQTRSSLCAAFLTTYSYAATQTRTTTPGVIYQRRAAPTITGTIPSYATSQCDDVTQYWSACQCFGISPTTIVATTTTTVVAPTPTCTEGLEYAFYTGTAGWSGPTVPVATLVSGLTPQVTGLTPVIGFPSPDEGPRQFYGTSYPGSTADYNIIDHRGYLHPTVSGNYVFSPSYVDDFLGLWLGSNAVNGFSYNNADVTWQWSSQPWNSFYFFVPPSAVGTYIPIRLLWANGGGPGGLSLTVTDPSSNVVLSGSSIKNSQVVSSCSGISQAPAWQLWQNEVPA